ncbi:protein kinase domain-containing protein [Streptomyces sp. MB22_4]|uniref:protein kinase domain-containing protein n=1 Tax=Streptomyces sp. MB22_4 TaxID=3383120 RepID=UPI0039A018CD
MNGEDNGVEPLDGADPRRIGPIPLVGRLGAGGMGRVYLGVYEGRYAAVKQVLPSVVGEDKDFVRRFGHELDNLARLPADATARLLVGDKDARPPWFATAYVPGLTLREAVEAHGGPLPGESLWLLLRKAAADLAAVHALDMVHRDVKPSNVMLTLDGVTLIDYGVARAADQSQLTRTGVVVGTPAYMSPEQAAGQRPLTSAVDVFALGSIVAYAGCGRPPFGDESGHAVLYRIVHEEPDLGGLREIDAELAEVVAACLDKDPGNRPTAADLAEAAAGQAPSAEPLWPASITGLLRSRAEFAAEVPQVPQAEEEARTASEPAPTAPGPGGSAPESRPASASEPAVVVGEGGAKRPGRSRRTKVFLAVVPVVVVAGAATLAVRLLPYATGPHRDGAAGTPGSSVSVPAGATAAGASGTPGPTGKGSASPAGDKKHDKRAGKGQDGKGADGSGSDSGSGSGSGAGSASGGGSGSGTGSGSGSGGSGTSGGGSGGSTGSTSGGGGSTGGTTGGTSGSGGSTGSGGSGGSTGGSFRLKNAENGECVTQVYGAAGFGGCDASTARWTFRSASGGTVKIINVSTGACLSANMKGQNVFVGDCGSVSSAILWHTGSGNTLSTAFDGGCLALSFGNNVSTQTCQPGTAAQNWARV